MKGQVYTTINLYLILIISNKNNDIFFLILIGQCSIEPFDSSDILHAFTSDKNNNNNRVLIEMRKKENFYFCVI